MKVRIRKGKTGERIVRVIASASLVAMYMETHPFRGVPDAPLWLSEANSNMNERLSWVSWNRIIKETAEKAGIADKRKWHHYTLRHGFATEAAVVVGLIPFDGQSPIQNLFQWHYRHLFPTLRSRSRPTA